MCSRGTGEECSEKDTTHLTLHFLLPEFVEYTTVACPFGPHIRICVLRWKIWLYCLKIEAKCNFTLIVNTDNPSSTDGNVSINPVIHPSHLGQSEIFISAEEPIFNTCIIFYLSLYVNGGGEHQLAFLIKDLIGSEGSKVGVNLMCRVPGKVFCVCVLTIASSF